MNLTPIAPYFKFIQDTLNKKLNNRDDAQDTYQEILIYLFLKEETEIKYPKAYLYKICISHIIKRGNTVRTEELEDTITIGPKVVLSSDSGWNEYEFDDRMMNRLKSIPGALYEPLALQVFDNLSISQIAVRLALNENTVKTNIRRAKLYLKSEGLQQNKAQKAY